MNGTLTRFAYLNSCVLGQLTFGSLTLATIELPWRPDLDGPGGEFKRSCVPDGLYTIRPRISPKHHLHYALVNEALGVYYAAADIPKGQDFGRSEVLIHIGNSTRDIEGCIAVGAHHANDALMVVDSRIAMARLRAVLGDIATHHLIIRPHEGTRENAA